MLVGPDGGPSNYVASKPPPPVQHVTPAAPAPGASGTTASTSGPETSALNVTIKPDTIDAPGAATEPPVTTNSWLQTMLSNIKTANSAQPPVTPSYTPPATTQNPFAGIYKLLAGPVNGGVLPGSTPPTNTGVPKAGTSSYLAANGQPADSMPAGTLFSQSTEPCAVAAQNGAALLKGDEAGLLPGNDPSGINAFVNGTAYDKPPVTLGPPDKAWEAQKANYDSLSPEQRTQVALQTMGPQQTAQYLSILQDNVGKGTDTKNSAAALSTFQTGFNNLVQDGQISQADVRALAASPMDQTGSNGSGVAKFFAGLPQTTQGRAAQNAFISSSYDTAQTLLAQDPSKNGSAADLLFASGTQVLGATSSANQAAYLKTLPSTLGSSAQAANPNQLTVQSLIAHSLNGEALADTNVRKETAPLAGIAYVGEGKPYAPFNGTSQLINTIAGDAMPSKDIDAGSLRKYGPDVETVRLGRDTKQQQDAVAAYDAVNSLIGAPDSKNNATYSSLVDADQDGSGLRVSLAKLFNSAMPAIINHEVLTQPDPGPGATPVGSSTQAQQFAKSGSQSNLVTSLGHFTEFELGGNYNQKSDGETIGSSLGASYGEFATDVNNAAISAKTNTTSATADLDSKYGALLFADTGAPGSTPDGKLMGTPAQRMTQTNLQIGNAYSLLGAAIGGVSEGLNDLDARKASSEEGSEDSTTSFASSFALFAGAVVDVIPGGEVLENSAKLLTLAGAGLDFGPEALSGDSSTPPSPTLTWQAYNKQLNSTNTFSPFASLLSSLQDIARQTGGHQIDLDDGLLNLISPNATGGH